MSHHVEQVAEDTYAVTGEAVNWTLLTEGDRLTLIDAGYPGDHDDVIASIRSIGFTPAQIAAVLITHAHVDHIGSLPRLLSQWTAPVLTSTREAEHAHRDFLEQATPTDVAVRSWRPRVAVWGLHVMRAGGTQDIRVPEASAFGAESPLEVPGHPVPVVTPGHTSGHTCYFLPAVGAIVTGDALVTGHAISRREGPQQLEEFFHHDAGQNAESLDLIADLDADRVLPGHGAVWRGPIADAVAQARA